MVGLLIGLVVGAIVALIVYFIGTALVGYPTIIGLIAFLIFLLIAFGAWRGNWGARGVGP